MTLFEIVERLKENKTCPYGDLRLAVLMLDSLLTFSRGDLTRIAKHAHPSEAVQEEAFRRCKTAFASKPLEWLGVHNLPESEEYQQRRRVAFAILREVEAEEQNR